MKHLDKRLKKYLLDFVPEEIEKYEIFTKVFGKGFAKNRLMMNLSKVYADDLKKDDERRI